MARLVSNDPRVDDAGVSAIEGDLIRGVDAGDCARGDVMVAIAGQVRSTHCCRC